MNNVPYQQLSLFPQQQYQQAYQPQFQNAPVQASLVWVSSEDYARNYPVVPGNTMYFINENDPGESYLYVKSADAIGKPTFRKSRIIDESEPKSDLAGFIKREEIDNIISDLVQREVEKRMSEFTLKPARRHKQEDMEE